MTRDSNRCIATCTELRLEIETTFTIIQLKWKSHWGDMVFATSGTADLFDILVQLVSSSSLSEESEMDSLDIL